MTLNPFNLLILLGVMHGLILSVLLIFSKSSKMGKQSHLLLALVLIFYTLPVLKTVLFDIGFFNAYQTYFLSIELLYGLGPSLYLYSKSVSDPSYKVRGIDLLHFVPVLLELMYYFSSAYSDVSSYRLTAARDSYHLIWMFQQVGSILSIIIYLGFTIRLLVNYSQWVKANYSSLGKRTLEWLEKPILLYSFFFILWFCLRAIDIFWFNDNLSIKPYYPLLIILSFTTYWIATNGYLKVKIDAVGYANENYSSSYRAKKKILSNKNEEKLYKNKYNQLIELMSSEKLFLINDLSLTNLAQRLDLNPRVLSKIINLMSKNNFYDFINQYRINEFKNRVISSKETTNLLELAFKCGFNSKATFNHIFKKYTGLTPSQYRKQENNKI